MSIVVCEIVSFIVAACPGKALRRTLLKTAISLGAFFSIPLFSNNILAQATDTLRRETLEEVSVSAQRTPSVMQTAAPTQVIDAEHIEHSGALQLSDAVRRMAGVTLKDYGGVGGVKTVSSRGLGSQFSAVTLDGIPIDDSQNGQVDLGRYTLGNTAYISLSQGQEQSSLLSARAYAAGNVLNMETSEPQFFPGEHIKLRAGMEVGSFGLWNPTLLWQQRWSRRLKSSLYVNYLSSDGDYPFVHYYTTSHQDSSAVERRKHSAVWMLSADGNLFYAIGPDNTLTAKLHYLRGAHELPGPITHYSQAESKDYTREEMTFAQARWRVEREAWRWQVLGKVRSSYDHYENDKYDDYYRQREGYLSGSVNRSLTPWLDMDMAADYDLSHLESDLKVMNLVTRRNLTAVAALHTHFETAGTKVDFRANVLYYDTRDRVADLKSEPHFQKTTPFVALMWTLGTGTTLRAFYKDSYRAPNFGELYFFQLMAPKLDPERARQLNMGLTQVVRMGNATLQLTADVYRNRVTDKIVSYPQSNMYYWTTANIGTADITGLDATADFNFMSLSLQVSYSYQKALDHSDKNGKFYGHQLVYTPRHSGGGSLRWENRWVNVGITAMAVGERYSMPQNSEKNRLVPYCDLGLSLDRSFDLHLGTLRVSARILNLLDSQYEVVRSYPMMGRNWRVGISYEI